MLANIQESLTNFCYRPADNRSFPWGNPTQGPVDRRFRQASGHGKGSMQPTSAGAAERRTSQMRIAVCAKLDLFGAIALNHLLPRLVDHKVAVFYSNKRRNDEVTVPELARLRLLERDLPLGVLFPLLERSPASEGFRTFQQLADAYGLSGTILTDLKADGDRPLLAAFQPDLILSVRFSLIFPQALIDQPRHGIINVHPGRLPDYGGLFAPFRQMLNGEQTLGCTIHMVDRGIDTGPILAIEPVPLDPAHSMIWHSARLYAAGARRVADFVDRLAAGLPLRPEPQDPSARAYYHFPTNEEFAAFAARGFETATPDDYIDCLRLFLPSIDLAAIERLVPTAAAIGRRVAGCP